MCIRRMAIFAALSLVAAGCSADAQDESGSAPIDEVNGSATENDRGVDDANQTEADRSEPQSEDGVGDVGTTSAAATAASCVRLEQGSTHHWHELKDERVKVPYSWARATNRCKTSKRVRLIWRWAVDGGCVDLAPGRSRYEERSRRGRPDPYITEVRKC